MNLGFKDSVRQWTNESLHERPNSSMNEMNNSMNQRNHQWISKSMVQPFRAPMIRWICESTNQCMNGCHRTNEPRCQWILPTSSSKTLWSLQFLPEVQTELSSILRILPPSPAKSAPVCFFPSILKCKANLSNANRALPTVSCEFCQLHLRRVLWSLHF